MKKPMTPEELFNKIKSILEKRTCCRIFWTMGWQLVLYPALTVRFLAGWSTSNPAPIRTYEFDLRSGLDYGGGTLPAGAADVLFNFPT